MFGLKGDGFALFLSAGGASKGGVSSIELKLSVILNVTRIMSMFCHHFTKAMKLNTAPPCGTRLRLKG